MSHANAALTVHHRLKVSQLVVDQGVPISEVAARFQVPAVRDAGQDLPVDDEADRVVAAAPGAWDMSNSRRMWVSHLRPRTGSWSGAAVKSRVVV